MARRRRYSGGYYDSWYTRFPKSTPREAKGGIKAQSKRGTFGESWWAKRWISVLESFDIGARLGRGRSYARSGQVLSIDVAQGKVTAKVQGSRSTPYSVSIKVKPLSKADWRKLAGVFSSQAIFAAKLLAGEMPQDIEQAFKQAGLSLFPQRLHDLDTDCSCPDWSNPCKHIAAVYYLLGEEFDRDPFLIFRLRGIEREELIGLIGGSAAPPAAEQDEAVAEKKTTRRKGGTRTAAKPEAAGAEDVTPALPPEPLPTDRDAFWGNTEVPEDFFGEVRTPPVSAALCKRLGSVPFWRAGEKFLDFVEPIYSAASRGGIDVFVGRQGEVEAETARDEPKRGPRKVVTRAR